MNKCIKSKGGAQMNANNSILTRVFTQNSLKSFICPEEQDSILSSVVRRYQISYDDDTKNETIISEIYHYLGKSYRNEYFYKNSLLNKLIIGAHRINTTTALTEVPVAKSKADFIMINGKAVVYEIKTELDTFDRLETQLTDYYKAFDHVCVVTSEAQSRELLNKFANDPIGVYVLSDKNTLHRVKEPEEYRDNLDKESVFKILNKPEYENIILQIQSDLPSVTPVKYYRECKKILCNLEIDELYNLFLKELKKRNRIDKIDIYDIPYALRFLVYFSKFQETQIEQLDKYLSKPFEGVK